MHPCNRNQAISSGGAGGIQALPRPAGSGHEGGDAQLRGVCGRGRVHLLCAGLPASLGGPQPHEQRARPHLGHPLVLCPARSGRRTGTPATCRRQKRSRSAPPSVCVGCGDWLQLRESGGVDEQAGGDPDLTCPAGLGFSDEVWCGVVWCGVQVGASFNGLSLGSVQPAINALCYDTLTSKILLSFTSCEVGCVHTCN